MNNPLHEEFSRSHGNAEACGYGNQTHGTTYNAAYVEWLERLVTQLRTRPDLQPHDEPHWPTDV